MYMHHDKLSDLLDISNANGFILISNSLRPSHKYIPGQALHIRHLLIETLIIYGSFYFYSTLMALLTMTKQDTSYTEYTRDLPISWVTLNRYIFVLGFHIELFAYVDAQSIK
jgi:hypothetical protein